MFNKYYQEELHYLRELGREFSQAFPALAPMLADRGADPDVERLLEGVAFLTGRIRQKLDDEIPEIIIAIASLLFPHFIRPFPACSVLELLPAFSGEGAHIARGAEFASVDVEGTPCRFRSTAPCDLWPLRIADARLETLPAGRQQLRIELETIASGGLSSLPRGPMRLHLAGELFDSLRLLAWMLEETQDVVLIKTDATGREERQISLGVTALAAAGFDDEEPLLPLGRSTFPGFRLLQEYYALPHKFAFVDIFNVARAAELGPDTQRFAIAIRFGRRLQDAAPISKDSVKLHCVPIVNLFETTAEPVRLTQTRERYPVTVAGLSVKHGEVYAIENVQTVQRGRGQRREIPCFYDFAHHTEMSRGASLFYTPHYTPSVVGEGVDVAVSFGTPEDASDVPDADVASLSIIATNRGLASRLRPGDIRVPMAGSPTGATFRNLYAATPHVPPPFGRELHWRVVAHAAMSLRSITELEVLRSVLDVYNLQALVDRQVARANELRLDALKEVKVSPAERLYKGSLVRGVNVDISLDEAGFNGEGDLHLFGAVLDRFFSHYVSLNSFSRTSVLGISSNVRYSWPARSGNLTML